MDAKGDPFRLFQDHSTGKNNNTELVVLEAIRSAHPDQDVTPVPSKQFDIIGWANSGHAKLDLIRENNDFYARRLFDVPENRLGGEGKLDEKVIFGCYRLVSDKKSFFLYAAEWPFAMERLTLKSYFFLSPKTNVIDTGSINPIDDLLSRVGKWTSELHEEIYVFDGFEWIKDPELWKNVNSCHWDDVVLDPATKQGIIDDVHGFFDSKEVYREFAVPWKRGIIFHGLPGCGKTLSIKALMRSLDQRKNPVVSLLVKTFEGCSTAQDAVRLSFSMARQMAPCLLIFEDLDSLISDDIRSYFLNEVDGLESNHGILIIATTNHLDRLDPGISKRPSRFDRKYHFKVPNQHERLLYCKHWQKKLEKNSTIDINYEVCDLIASLTQGFTFAYLQELLVQTLLTMVRGQVAPAKSIRAEDVADNSRAVDEMEKDLNFARVDRASETQVTGVKPEPRYEDSTRYSAIPKHLLDNPFVSIICDQVAILGKDIKDDVASVTEPQINEDMAEEGVN